MSLNSTHPLSRAIQSEHQKRDGKKLKVSNFLSIAGKGLQGIVDGKKVTLGRRELVLEAAPSHDWLSKLPLPEAGLTEVIVHSETVSGRLLLRDTPRAEASALIHQLNTHGVKTSMLTGDRAASAQIIANEVGLTDYKHSLHPEDKVAIIQQWRNKVTSWLWPETASTMPPV